MKLDTIIHELEKFAPLYLQESYDNSGLLIGNREQEIIGALVTLDVTEAVLEEAIGKNCNLIIAHHPVIFKGLKSITGRNAVERVVSMAIKKDLAIYAIHTNLDNIQNGINGILSKKLGLINTRILAVKKEMLRKIVTFCPISHADVVREALFTAGAGRIGNYDSCSFNAEGQGTFRGSEDTNPFVGEKGQLHVEPEVRIETIYPVYIEKKVIQAMQEAHPYEEVAYDIYPLGNVFEQTGAGMVGELEKTMEEKQFLEFVKSVTGTPCIRHSGLNKKNIRTVALCGGAGSFLIHDALRSGADIFLTGDVKYHDFFEGDSKMVIADIGHFESEQFAKDLISSLLIKKFSNFAVLISETNTNSVNYL
ncbi:MAG: Nif3-like dinuclear metal center hexameric protein [Bacteroidetes bacterium]|nr:Nif3-like dinuclear metal center hexameric protein [Bacteroidota bacterium]